MPVQFFIALYRPSHWVLLATDNGIPSLSEPIRCFGIEQTDEDEPDDDAWRNVAFGPILNGWKRSYYETRAGLMGPNFSGLLVFPPCAHESVTLAHVHNALDRLPVMPFSVSTNPMRRYQWSCKRWIVDALLRHGPGFGMTFEKRMCEESWVGMVWGTVLYHEICETAGRLERDGKMEKARDGSLVKCVRFPDEYFRSS
ncbi:unnamed protein product [Peniophora sp. CBMAI 1063]|nr:unnamed protein product [Peniophora sp. CBMAI 1063]